MGLAMKRRGPPQRQLQRQQETAQVGKPVIKSHVLLPGLCIAVSNQGPGQRGW